MRNLLFPLDKVAGIERESDRCAGDGLIRRRALDNPIDGPAFQRVPYFLGLGEGREIVAHLVVRLGLLPVNLDLGCEGRQA